MAKGTSTFLSIFSGCGGFDLGFQNAGFQSIGAVDIDPTVLQVHEKNIGSPVFQADLSLGELPFVALGRADVLIAGSPCQGFSTIGKRRLDDPRNDLLLVTGRLAARYKPKLVIAENVPAVASGKHRKYWEGLHQILREAGYQTAELTCYGPKVGVPQRRRRLLLVGWRAKRTVTLEIPEVPGGSLRDALHKIEGASNHDLEYLECSSIDYQIAEKLKPGQKLSNVRSGPRSVHTWQIPEVFGSTTKKERDALEEILRLRRRNRVRDFGDADPVQTRLLQKKFGKPMVADLEAKGYLKQVGNCHDLVGTFNGKYRRLHLDEPSYTVDTRFGDPRCFLHPTEHRGFTVREAARIQGFPDNFVFDGTKAEQYRMVGNAVPPPMAENLAHCLKKTFGL